MGGFTEDGLTDGGGEDITGSTSVGEASFWALKIRERDLVTLSLAFWGW